MRLADDHIAISLEIETIRLRPTLRAAFTLCNTYGGFHTLSHLIAQGHVSVVADVIRQASGDEAVNAYLVYIGDKPHYVTIMELREPLLEFVVMLSGTKQREADQSPVSKPIPFAEYHTKLFQIGTGWLGWTPEATWDATPAEIINAQIGRRDMLTAIFGSGKNEDTVDLTADRDGTSRATLNALGDTSILDMSQVP